MTLFPRSLAPAAALAALALAACADDVREPLSAEVAAPRPAATAAADPGVHPDSIFNRYIVQFRDGVGRPDEVSADLVSRHGGRRTRVFRHVLNGFAAVNLPPQAVEALRRNPNVLRVEEEKPVPMHATQTGASWGLDRMDQVTGRDDTFNYAFTGAGVHLYVLDTGIRGDHQEFAGRLGNGHSVIWYENDPWQDNDGHGTKVAGVAAGTTYGVAKGATVHAVKINTTGSAWPNDIIAGLDWVAANHVKPAVANLSYGHAPFMDVAIQNLINRGVVVTKSAGNSNVDACDPSTQVAAALVVGSTHSGDAKSSFSNFGSCVDLWAPGSGVVTASNTSATAEDAVSGTSFSAPYVAGIAATVLQQRPSMSSASMRSYLQSTGTWNVLTGLDGASPNILAYSLHSSVSVGGLDYVTSTTTATRTWSAVTLGGNGWTYDWQYSINGGAWTWAGSGSGFSRSIPANSSYRMDVRLYATSAGRTYAATKTVWVSPPEPSTEPEPICTNWKICEVTGG